MAGVQQFVHSLEQGPLARVIRLAALFVLILALFLVYLFVQFKGFGTETAMDQAQIARNIAKGDGFTTQYIRPLALWMLTKNGKEIPEGNLPDFYNAPLNPLVNSAPLLMAGASLEMKSSDVIYLGDRVIAGFGILLFLLSVGIWYWIARRLFDAQLALVAAALILVTDLLWQFSLSGLPQMLMMFILSGICLAAVRALELHAYGASPRQVPLLLAGIAAGFGLLTLAHGLGVWFFLGWLLFALIYFDRKLLTALISVAVFTLMVAPWLFAVYQTSGNPFGLSIYTAASGTASPETGLLRSLEPDFSGILQTLRTKVRNSFGALFSNLFPYLGLNFAALVFFVSLLHPFRNPPTQAFRWAVLSMWAFASVGMALFGVYGTISSNQLHALFIPIFAIYGMAFLLVLFMRLGIEQPILRTVFSGVVVFLCGVPMLLVLLGGPGARVQWPPYIPPVIAYMEAWFDADEIVCSDMPWAVAWYANRQSLLLPDTVKTFNRINDYSLAKAPVRGLFLTPVTRYKPLFAEIYKGNYREWAPLIVNPPNVRGFALPAFTLLPNEGDCIVFADSARWKSRPLDRLPAAAAPAPTPTPAPPEPTPAPATE